MPPKENLTHTERMIASCTGALLTSLVVTPFDVVKTRLQAQAHPTLWQCEQHFAHGVFDICQTCGVDPANVRFRGTADAFSRIYANEGLVSFWRGLPPTLLMALPSTVAYFTTYDMIRERLGSDRSSTPVIAGAASRTFAVTLISPLELVRTKLQATKGYSLLDVIGDVSVTVRREGWRALFRGLFPTLLRDVPFSIIYWSGYETLKKWRLRGTEGNLTFLQSFTAGALSGTLAAVMTLPFDVVKTRQQSSIGQPQNGMAVQSGKDSARQIMSDIVRRSGYQGLFVGIVPRVAKVAPACAIMISSYELGKSYFTQNRLAP
eukprot:m.61870 g.61870  ORF g.61870 m.61870 type:complete len:320 (-) comp13753_c0_seq2:380-1339(-)